MPIPTWVQIDKKSNLTDNPNREGTYRMMANDANRTYVQVPFSKVAQAEASGYRWRQSEEQNRYNKDYLATQPKKGFVKAFTETSPLSLALSLVNHPLDTINNFPAALGDEARRVTNELETARMLPNSQVSDKVAHAMYAVPFVGAGMKETSDLYNQGDIPGYIGASLGTALSVISPKAAEETASSALSKVKTITSNSKKFMAGKNIDEIIPGQTITPRQQYNIAKKQGVNLDLAQATQGMPAKMIKRPVEYSLAGSGKFDDLNAANQKALAAHTEKVLNDIAPAMDRSQFGIEAKNALLKHQKELNDTAGQIFDDLTEKAGDVQPDMTDVRMLAKKIVGDNQGYFQKHPEMLKGATGGAWKIVNNLAEDEGKPITQSIGLLDSNGNPITRQVQTRPPDTWSDLHKLRSDLMNEYRSPEIVGSNAEGWLKQLVGAVDNSMTGSASGLSPEQLQQFRAANDIYTQMKSVYDNPQSPLYHVVRSPDGLQAANQLLNANPTTANHVRSVAPELAPQYQRQAMEKILSPAGNAVPDWKTLSSRFGRTQKEALNGILSPSQSNDLENIAHTSRIVNWDSNPSGSGKVGQAVGEASALGTGAMEGFGRILSGHPISGLVQAATAPATMRLQSKIAGYLTDPEKVSSVMNSPAGRTIPNPNLNGITGAAAAGAGTIAATKGPDKWMNDGATKLSQLGVDDGTIEFLRQSRKGQRTLMWAGSIPADSPGMQGILQSLNTGNEGEKTPALNVPQGKPIPSWVQLDQ